MDKDFLKILENKISNQISNFPLLDKKYAILLTLGVGRFGRVKLGYDIIKKEFFAIKILKKNSSYFSFSQFFKEIKTLKYLKNTKGISNIKNFNFEGILEKNKKKYKVMYYVSKFCLLGELFDFLEYFKNLNLSIKILLMKKILLATKSIFKKKIAHGDMKPENLLITANFDIKLCDFGAAADFENFSNLRNILTMKYCAPEILRNSKNNKGNAKKSEVFSLGVIFYVIMTNSFPTPKFENLKNLKFEKNDKISKNLKEIILCMLEKDTNKRIGFEEVFEKIENFAEKKKSEDFENLKKNYFDVKTSQVLRKLDLQIKKFVYIKKINRHIKINDKIRKYYNNTLDLQRFFRENNSLIEQLLVKSKKNL